MYRKEVENAMGVYRQRLVVELHGVQSEAAKTVSGVYDALEQLTVVAGMRVFVPPLVVRVPVACAADCIKTEHDSGVSGQVIWLESGAQVHTWPEDGFVAVDMFSCKRFDMRDVVDFLVKYFGAEWYEVFDPNSPGACILTGRAA